MGWFAPATILIKILLQQTWKSKIGWDEILPQQLLPVWERWIEELHNMITERSVPRRYSQNNSPIIQQQLHRFCNASQVAYGGVVYLRLLHRDATVSISLVTSKTRVAPLTGSTIPRLELCGALLLSRLLHRTAQDLKIPFSNLYAWCDSSAVLGWLNMSTTRMKVYVANRVAEVVKLVPSEYWRYVRTTQNPADLASRGLPISQLLGSTLWWQGPAWLRQLPVDWPRRPDNLNREIPELKPIVLLIQPPPPEIDLWTRFSSFHKLVSVAAWCRRFISNSRKCNVSREAHLSSSELASSKVVILHLSQSCSYPSKLSHLSQGKAVLQKSSLYSLSPLLGVDGLLRVGGRLKLANISSQTKHPIILSNHSPITKCLVKQVHLDSGHAGIGTMLAILADSYHIIGLKSLLRQISHNCVVCQKAYARTAAQLMGQLPPERLEPAPPFTHVGVDYAGPLMVKRGNPRKPTLVKVYVCLFLCFGTKAAHLELVSELTTEAFLAALIRFVARRGVPITILSDNGTNFVGAKNESKDLTAMLQTPQTQEAVRTFAATRSIQWKFSPSRSPHFGGLWEAGIKCMKVLLCKLVGTHHLTYEELSTVLTEAEATLNSRPLMPAHSTSPDGSEILTAGHFIIGRPLHSLPSRFYSTNNICNLRRWNLVNRLTADLWDRWHTVYLQSLQQRSKWQERKPNLSKNDIVLLKERDLNRRNWPLARVLEVHPGADGLVRVVTIKCDGKIYKRAVVKLVPLFRAKDGPSPARECVQACRGSPGAGELENNVTN